MASLPHLFVRLLSVAQAPGPDFDCAMRTVALAHAARIIQDSSQLKDVRAGLQLDMTCGASAATPPAAGPPFPHTFVAPGGSRTTLFVATTGDDSQGDGSIEKPFKSLEKARDTLRAGDGGGATVFLRNG